METDLDLIVIEGLLSCPRDREADDPPTANLSHQPNVNKRPFRGRDEVALNVRVWVAADSPKKGV